MKDKKTIIVIVVSVVATLVLAGTIVLLYLGVSKLNDIEKDLGNKMAALKVFYKNNPFPDQANIAKEAQNVTLMTNRFAEVVDVLKKRQVEPRKVTPTTFTTMLVDARDEVKKMGSGSGTTIPPAFGLGFEKYFAATRVPLPPTEVVHLLCQQLTMVTNICKVITDEKAAELTSISRSEIFEDVAAAPTATGPGGMPPMMPPTAPPVPGAPGAPGKPQAQAMDTNVFTKLHFTLQFTAREQNLLKILNRFASHDMIIVVTSMELDNEGAKLAGTGDSGKQAEPGAEVKPDEPGNVPAAKTPVVAEKKSIDKKDRIVCAPERVPPMKVRMELDIYNFKGE